MAEIKIENLNLENCLDVNHLKLIHGQALPKAHYNVLIRKLRNYKKVIFF